MNNLFLGFLLYVTFFFKLQTRNTVAKRQKCIYLLKEMLHFCINYSYVKYTLLNMSAIALLRKLIWWLNTKYGRKATFVLEVLTCDSTFLVPGHYSYILITLKYPGQPTTTSSTLYINFFPFILSNLYVPCCLKYTCSQFDLLFTFDTNQLTSH